MPPASPRSDLHPNPAGGAPVARPSFAERAPAPAPPRAARHEPTVHAALELPRLTITRMAESLGVPRATLEAYRLGTRRMPAPVRARLADYLRAHAAQVVEVAAALAADAERLLGELQG